MTSAQVVETSVNYGTSNSPSQLDYTHPDVDNLHTYDKTAGFKPFTVITCGACLFRLLMTNELGLPFKIHEILLSLP